MGKHKTKKNSHKHSKSGEYDDYEECDDPEYYCGGVNIEPCPFCGSDNIIVALREKQDIANMVLLCLGCKTKFELEMMCNEDNIKDAFRFWNSRFGKGKK